jgi:beta-barrel assembly-enhancing protease
MKLRVLVMLLLSSCLGSCNMTAGGINLTALTNVGTSLTKIGTIDQSQELVLGDEFAAMLLGATRLHPNGALQTYVNSVGRYLASHSTRPDLPWTFGVLDTPDLNAFAVPGGYVFVTSGLLANLSSEAELAAVLAHEIIHINERHQLRQLERDNSVNLLSNLANAVTTYQEERKPGSSINRYKNRQIAESVMNAGHQLFTKGLSRDDELSADSLAIRLAARAGYDPYAMAAVMQQIDSVQADSSSVSLILATHPAPADRLQHLENQLNQLEHQHRSASSGKLLLAERYQLALRSK